MHLNACAVILWRGILGIGLALVATAFGATEPVRSFDIAAGAAETALKQFARQSGVVVLFSTEAARGVRTNAVKGDLQVQEAVERMLAGTPLRVVKDSKNGVLRIARDPGPNGRRAAPKATSDRPGIQTCTIQPQPPHHK